MLILGLKGLITIIINNNSDIIIFAVCVPPLFKH